MVNFRGICRFRPFGIASAQCRHDVGGDDARFWLTARAEGFREERVTAVRWGSGLVTGLEDGGRSGGLLCGRITSGFAGET